MTASADVALAQAPRVRTQTVWAWLIALLPLVLIVPITMYFVAVVNSAIVFVLGVPTGGTASDARWLVEHELALVFNPWSFSVAGLSVATYALGVWFAFLDARSLRRRGIIRPFHAGWMFLTAWAYLIGRADVLRRRGSRGAAPLWTFLGVQTAIFVGVPLWVPGLAMQSLESVLQGAS